MSELYTRDRIEACRQLIESTLNDADTGAWEALAVKEMACLLDAFIAMEARAEKAEARWEHSAAAEQTLQRECWALIKRLYDAEARADKSEAERDRMQALIENVCKDRAYWSERHTMAEEHLGIERRRADKSEARCAELEKELKGCKASVRCVECNHEGFTRIFGGKPMCEDCIAFESAEARCAELEAPIAAGNKGEEKS